MALLLHIETAVETASICISENEMMLAYSENINQREHSVWLHKTIQGMFSQAARKLSDLDAVSVSIGPGSYTGLRVGLSAAKGICYALDKPLITINTLKLIALAVQNEAKEMICPMIDARRKEVYMAAYNKTMIEVIKPQAIILNENSLSGLFDANQVLFCGNGCTKFQSINNNDNAVFTNTNATAENMIIPSLQKFAKKEFANLTYTEPVYIKDFFSTYGKPFV